jgi:hypothetical protein
MNKATYLQEPVRGFSQNGNTNISGGHEAVAGVAAAYYCTKMQEATASPW